MTLGNMSHPVVMVTTPHFLSENWRDQLLSCCSMRSCLMLNFSLSYFRFSLAAHVAPKPVRHNSSIMASYPWCFVHEYHQSCWVLIKSRMVPLHPCSVFTSVHCKWVQVQVDFLCLAVSRSSDLFLEVSLLNVLWCLTWFYSSLCEKLWSKQKNVFFCS